MAEFIAGYEDDTIATKPNETTTSVIAGSPGSKFALDVYLRGGTINTGSITAGSQSYVFGKSGTNYYELSVDANGYLNTNASVSAGSVAYVPAGSVIITKQVAWDSVGSVYNVNSAGGYAGSDSWVVAGSVRITNPADIGSLGTQVVVGSVNVGALPSWTGIGSVVGSVYQATNPWIVLGSQAITNVVSVSGNVLASGTLSINNPSTIGSFTTQTVSVSAGSVQTYNPVGVGSIYGIGVGSVAVAVISPATIGSLATQNIIGSVTSTISAGSVIVTNTVAVGSQSYVWGKSGTGYTEIYADTSGRIAGSIVYMPAISVGAGPDVGKLDAVVPGSLSFVGGNYNGSLYPLRLDTGSYLFIAGSISSMPAVTANAGSQSYLFAKSGTGYVELTADSSGYLNTIASVTAGSESYIKAGSVIVTAGSINVSNAVGSVAVTKTAVWDGVGSIYGIGVGSVAVSVISPATVGSLATQGVVGSVASQLYGTSGGAWYPLLVGSESAGGYLRVDLHDDTVVVSAGSVRVTSGSIQVTVGAGSIQTYNPIGVGSIYGIGIGSVAVSVISPATVGSLSLQNVTGSVTIYAGSVQTYNPVGVGSIYGIGIGSVYATTNLYAGSTSYTAEAYKQNEEFANGVAGPGSPFLVLSFTSGLTARDILLINGGSTDVYYNMGISGATFNVSTSGTYFPAGGERGYGGVLFSKFAFKTEAGSVQVFAHLVR